MSRMTVMTPSGILVIFLGTLQANTANFAVFAADGCKDMDFKVTLEGKTLDNHVIKTVQATDDGHCQTLCFLDDRCISYSFGTNASGEKYMCELSDSDHLMHPEDVVDRPGVIYRSAQNSCTCRGKQTCRYDFVKKTAKCLCPTGFTGKNCETKINDCQSNPCKNGGSCQDKLNGFECACTNEYYGSICENVDNCVKYPCRNGGTCTDRSSYNNGCSCPSTHYGSRCEHFNYCRVDPTRCKDGSTCKNYNALSSRGYICWCGLSKYYDYNDNQCKSRFGRG